MLLPQAALHHTISSLSGSNSVKQIGQSPETSLRFEGLSAEAEADDAGAGAASKISRSSWEITRLRLTGRHVEENRTYRG